MGTKVDEKNPEIGGNRARGRVSRAHVDHSSLMTVGAYHDPTQQINPQAEPLIGIDELCRRMAGINKRTIGFYIELGLPCFKPSKRLRLFRWSAVERWMAARTN